MITITFDRVTRSFGGRPLFDRLDAKIRGGVITAVTGPNGSGKSTFLRLAGHLLRPDSGKVIVKCDDSELRRASYRDRLGIVTPELRFYPRLTAYENMTFFLGLRGKTLTVDTYRVLLNRVGLDETAIRGKFAGAFSTGMRQRLKFAVLLASGADVWLLDEPAANLDAAGRAMILREARQAAASGAVVLWATNDAGEEENADEVIRLGGNSARPS